MKIAKVKLKPGRDKSLRQGHPWLFSGGVASEEGPKDAALAQVEDAKGKPLGTGFYSPRSQIRVRMVAPPTVNVNSGFFAKRLRRALELREAVVGEGTTGYRLVNAEGDGLPGWTVDRYGDVLVSQIGVAGLEAMKEEAYAALAEVVPGASVVQANSSPQRRREGLGAGDEVIAGQPPEEAPFRESGLHFLAEIAGGQKTGFYCDQRESRRRVESLAGGRRILDLFAHTGAFGLYALRGGAESVVQVESAARLGEIARRQLELNREVPGIEAGKVTRLQEDVFEELRRHGERYGLVVCDPPPLARRRSAVNAAARAYKDLNRLALTRVESGGFFLTFSCSGAVDSKLFRQILFAAAQEASVDLVLLAPLAAAPDHPVSVYHPEGEYLKGWLCRVQGRRG